MAIIHLQRAATQEATHQMAIRYQAMVVSLLPLLAPVARADLGRAALLLDPKQDMIYARHPILAVLLRLQRLKNIRVLQLFLHQCTWQSSPIALWKWSRATWHVYQDRVALNI